MALKHRNAREAEQSKPGTAAWVFRISWFLYVALFVMYATHFQLQEVEDAILVNSSSIPSLSTDDNSSEKKLVRNTQKQGHPSYFGDVVLPLDNFHIGEGGGAYNSSLCKLRCTEGGGSGMQREELVTNHNQDEQQPSGPANSPLCIHFLHKFKEEGEGNKLPSRYLSFIQKWRLMNPVDCIVKHNPRNIADLLSSNKASLWLALFGSYQHFIQKCDLARYILMYFQGGVYADMDIEVKQELLVIQKRYPTAKVFLGTERILPQPYAAAMLGHRIRNGTREHSTRVANYWMMSLVARHPFWSHVMDIAQKRSDLPVVEDYDVIYTTGPDLLTEAYHTYDNDAREIALLGPREFSTLLRHHSDGYWKAHTKLSADPGTYLRITLILIQHSSFWILLSACLLACLLIISTKLVDLIFRTRFMFLLRCSMLSFLSFRKNKGS
jgi:hypothetical protein